MGGDERLRSEYERLVDEGTRLAGGLSDLAQRATVYHHLHLHSGRNHVFPGIAAHGALWAGRYFRYGARLGRLLAWQYPFSARKRRERLAAMEVFANVFRDVNRRVCVETYASYHFTERFGTDPRAAEFVRPALLAALNRVHSARRSGIELPDDEKREVFETHFLDEQATVVGPMLDDAVADFDWPLVKAIALRPRIRFAYFPVGHEIRFRNFANREERIANGQRAFDYAASAGWATLTSALCEYDVLPAGFFREPEAHFDAVRRLALAT